MTKTSGFLRLPLNLRITTKYLSPIHHPYSHTGSVDLVDSVESPDLVEDPGPVSVGIGTTSFAGDD